MTSIVLGGLLSNGLPIGGFAAGATITTLTPVTLDPYSTVAVVDSGSHDLDPYSTVAISDTGSKDLDPYSTITGPSAGI